MILLQTRLSFLKLRKKKIMYSFPYVQCIINYDDKNVFKGKIENILQICIHLSQMLPTCIEGNIPTSVTYLHTPLKKVRLVRIPGKINYKNNK